MGTQHGKGACLRRSYVNRLLGSLHQLLRDGSSLEQAWSALEYHLHSLSAIAKLFSVEHAEAGRAVFEALCMMSRTVVPFRGMLCTFLLTERVHVAFVPSLDFSSEACTCVSLTGSPQKHPRDALTAQCYA